MRLIYLHFLTPAKEIVVAHILHRLSVCGHSKRPCLRGPVALPGRYNRYYHKIDCTHTLVHCGGASRPQGTHHGHGHGLCPTFSVLGFSLRTSVRRALRCASRLLSPYMESACPYDCLCDECAVIASAPHGAICIPSPALCGVGSLAPFDG